MITKLEALEAIMETWDKYKNIDHHYLLSDDMHLADEILNDIHRELEITKPMGTLYESEEG